MSGAAQVAMTTTLDAGRELDALVAEKVMGWRLASRRALGWGHGPDCWITGEADAPTRQWFAPSIDIAAAWLVVERMKEVAPVGQKTLQLVCYEYGRTYAAFSTDRDDDAYSEGNGEHATPLAICRAALAVVATGASQGGER